MTVRKRNDRRYSVSTDRAVIALIVLSVILALATFLRAPFGANDAGETSGLHIISDDQTLVLFQDFTLNSKGWSPGQISRDMEGLGPILGPLGNTPVFGTFTLPEQSFQAILQFELHLPHTPQEDAGIRLDLNGSHVGEIGYHDDAAEWSLSPSLIANQASISLAASSLPPLTGEMQRAQVTITLPAPSPTLTLSLVPADAFAAPWAIDNASVTVR